MTARRTRFELTLRGFSPEELKACAEKRCACYGLEVAKPRSGRAWSVPAVACASTRATSSRPRAGAVRLGFRGARVELRRDPRGDAELLDDDMVALALDDVLDLGGDVAAGEDEPGRLGPHPLVVGASSE